MIQAEVDQDAIEPGREAGVSAEAAGRAIEAQERLLGDVAGVLRGFPVAKELRVEEFLAGPPPARTASIVNAGELGLARG